MFYIYIHIAFILALFRQFLFIFSGFFSLLIRAFGWIHSFNLHRCMDAHSAKFVVLIVERFFLSGNRILFLACVNSALWLWSSPFLFHSCAVVGVFPCFSSFRFSNKSSFGHKRNDHLLKMPVFFPPHGFIDLPLAYTPFEACQFTDDPY